MKFGPDFFSHIVIATEKINVLRCLRSALWQAANIFIGLCGHVFCGFVCESLIKT